MHPTTLGLTLAAALAIPAAASSVVIDWITIGDPGNAAQSAANRTHSFSGGDGYGAVADTYRISRNETTIAQYVYFLNAVAATDTYGLYDTRMGTSIGKRASSASARTAHPIGWYRPVPHSSAVMATSGTLNLSV